MSKLLVGLSVDPNRLRQRLYSLMEVSERLVGSPAFKAGGTGDPRPAGSIPVRLRHVASALDPR